MRLPENIIKVNGFIDGKRAYVLIEVPTIPNLPDDNGDIVGKGRIIPVFWTGSIEHDARRMGLEVITTINVYNYISDRRLTEHIW